MKKILAVILMTVSGITLLGCVLFYYNCYHERKNSTGVMENLKETYITELPADYKSDLSGKKSKSPAKGAGEILQQEKPDFETLKIDWSGLKSQNEDIIAWIDIPGTVISYPVVQTMDDEYYLHHTITKEANDYGAIFLSSMNRKDFTDSHSIIYGHNMRDGTMFAGVNDYEERHVYESSPYIHIYTQRELIVYQVFSSFQSAVGSSSFLIDLKLGSMEYRRQLSEIKAASEYDTGTEITEQQPFITLMTCNSWGNAEERTSLHAIKIKEYDRGIIESSYERK